MAFLSPVFWPEVRRGAERFVHQLAAGLAERGASPRLITSHRGWPSRGVEDGLDVTRNWRPPDGRLRRRCFEDYLTHVPLSYLSLLRGEDHVAHAVYPTDALAAARWSARTGGPSLLSYMGIPDRRWLARRRLRADLTLRAVAGTGAVVALSEAAVEGFWRWLGVEARLIHPGVDVSSFAPGGQRAPAPTIVCAADAAEPRKRVALLVEAFARVRRVRPDARLLLSRPRDPASAAALERAGDGLETVDLDDRVALRDAYRQAWVSALPSLGEAFGLVLVEALACGTPVVATNVDGMREIVDRAEVGRLFDGDQPEPLADALLEAFELAEDPNTAVACRARAKDFSSDRCTERYASLYRELLG
ncbi:MAG TPA: glycosyltransferase family 4 protein [Solirubrobacteraceae bacterium]|nr:glycosyltransferase family 4 protein [Solirubrobacteraceae bacterium]